MKLLMAAALALGLSGCAGVQVDRYKNEKPVLDLKTYFNGTIDGVGMFQDRSGEVIKRFHVVIHARWEGNVGTLDEQFKWADGTTSQRVWTITRHDEHRYTGRAADVVGEAQGEAQGNALRWRYVMDLPVEGGKTYHVDFDDWMFLMDDNVMLNRSAMSKWGFHLGDVTLSFSKR